MTPIASLDQLEQRLMILSDKRREAEIILSELERPAPFDSRSVITWANRAVEVAEHFSLDEEVARALYLRGLAHMALWRERTTTGDEAGRNHRKRAEGDLERSFNYFIDVEQTKRAQQKEQEERQRQRDKAREPIKDQTDDASAAIEQLRCRSVQTALGLARLYEYANDPDNALRWIRRAIGRCNTATPTAITAIAYEALSDLFYNTGDMDSAIEAIRRVLTIQRQLNDIEGIATAQAKLATAHHGRNEIEAALQYNIESQELYERAAHHYDVMEERGKSRLCRYHMLTGRRIEAELRLSRHEAVKALDLATRVLEGYETLVEKSGDQAELAAVGDIYENIVHTYIIIAKAYELLGQLEPALDQCAKAFLCAKHHGRPHLLLPILLCVGRIHRLRGEIADALGAFRNALDMIEPAHPLAVPLSAENSLDRRRLQAQFHRELSETFQADRQFEQALEHYKLFAEIQESIAGTERQTMIAIQRVRFDTEQSELETQTLRDRNSLLEDELAYFVFTVGLRDGTAAPDQTKKEDSVQQGEERKSENKWIYFQNLLDARYPGFLRTLREQAPTLTKTHLQVCALMRLGLSNNEVAKALRMELRTLQSHRNDIRKRLPGSPYKDLVTWMLKITSSPPDSSRTSSVREQ